MDAKDDPKVILRGVKRIIQECTVCQKNNSEAKSIAKQYRTLFLKILFHVGSGTYGADGAVTKGSRARRTNV